MGESGKATGSEQCYDVTLNHKVVMPQIKDTNIILTQMPLCQNNIASNYCRCHTRDDINL